jgi:hypothetical protein
MKLKRVAGVAAILLVAGAVSVATASKTPKITITGSSYTQTTDPTGSQVIGEVDFSMNATTSGNGSASGTFTEQVYTVSNGTPTQVGSTNVNIDCLAANKSTGTVWFSGLVTAGSDQQQPAEEETQEQNIISAGNLILIGRFRDTNSDGIVDNRSLFMTVATTAYPNALVDPNNDVGTLSSPWYIQGYGTSAANACLLGDNAYFAADYTVVPSIVNHLTTQVQWLQPDDRHLVGSPVDGTAANMANPPAKSVYSLAKPTRTLLSQNLTLTISK